jgi:O-antigen ligase
VAVSIFVVFGLKIYVAPGDFIFINRIQDTGMNVLKFLSGEQKNSSLGQRFLMWDIALDVFKQQPLLGTGLGDFNLEIEQRIANKKTELAHAWPHAHNIYFNVLATSGISGFLTMIISLFIAPLRLVYRRDQTTDGPEFSHNFFIIFLAAFMLFGLSEDWFSRSTLVVAFVLCFAVYLPHSRRGTES